LQENEDEASKYLDLVSTDHIFAEAIQRAGNVFLAMFNSPAKRKNDYLPSTLYPVDVSPRHYLTIENPYPPIALLAENAYGVGFAHIEPDASGIIHSYPLFMKHEDNFYVNFSFQACLDLLGTDSLYINKSLHLYSDGSLTRKLPLSPDGEYYFRYYGAAESFRYIHFSDVILGRIPPGFFQNKIILIGSSAAGLRDYRTSPLDASIPGVELHATLMRNILDEEYVYWLNPWLGLLIVVLLLLFVANFIYRSRPGVSIGLFLFFSLLIVLSFYLIYYYKYYTMDYGKVLIPWLGCYLAMMFEHYGHQIKERKKVRNAFEHYVSKDVISQMLADANALKIGGEKKQVSVFFADIRSFSTFCETCQATDVTGLLHLYFNKATDIIIENKGLLDKYIGDAIVAIYNVPLPYPDYQFLACNSALGVLKHSLDVKAEYQNHPILKDFEIGIGIGTGELIIGNMGSDTIFNYTGIGDTMNLSSRLEGLNKYYKTSIIIDEETFHAVSDRMLCRYLDCVSVKGKSHSNKIYELVGLKTDYPEDDPHTIFVRTYETALKDLQESRFDQAEKGFIRALQQKPEDYCSSLMLERLKEIERESWNGVYIHQSK
ncbi:MAG: adenylate/guanylate cyclase domain-containing protein, partial [Candidatus Cloacimonadaceae bacterium]|nr:adenylate/guanylate cyclase domain-containing protein [Candidatus Cloacimonadaceae bacterium]